MRKGRKRRNVVVVAGAGDPCPRCGRATEIREHLEVTEKHFRQPFYYSRWFRCTNERCKTKEIMPERYKVMATDREIWAEGPEDGDG